MKGLLRGAGGLLIVVAVVGVGRLWSQDKPEPPAPRGRVALFNLTYVVSNYDKFKAFKAEMTEEAKVYENRLKGLMAQKETLDKDLQSAPPDTRDEIQKKQISAGVLLETLNREAKAALSKKADEQMVLVYKEVRSAAERYAKAHDIEVMMHYNEPLDDAELDTPANVGRKMGAGACIPLFSAPGVDVTKEVLALLQENARNAK